ncbi:MAG: DUF4912 domain-containing protein [Anaerolineae bacterium]|nr:DUF4912 domain-containing protein [Anaerolineae bacterium]
MNEYPDRAYFLPKDPHWTFIWWHVSPETVERVGLEGGFDPLQAQWTLRIHDVTDILFDDTNSHFHFDVDISPEIDHWYLEIWAADRNYCAQAGFKTAAGRFHPAVTSNTICLPRDGPSASNEESWTTLT